ncbi:NUDIX hydrolase [Anaeroarcus burkinensis]|uniref:NUDIX hydrolase n=1 Tax=Anaeroarcus burkinensis TaxID=82376 RepID=UPI0003FE3BAE|nr:CoA pyrophosphatase [Anaeroarcus burkinensis]
MNKLEYIREQLQEGLRQREVKLLQKGYFRAAVVVPILEIHGELAVLFQVRSSQMAWQPGDICFPGGRVQLDETPCQAARREMAEELGIDEDCLDLVGELPEVASPIGVWLHPYAGVLQDCKELKLQSEEVAETFCIPLAELLAMTPEVGRMEMATKPMPGFPHHLLPEYSKEWRRRGEYDVYFYVWKDRVIWGLTAQVLKNFLDVYRKAQV